MRQAFAGMLRSKQLYNYDLSRVAPRDLAQPGDALLRASSAIGLGL
jgi:hypothetical protein